MSIWCSREALGRRAVESILQREAQMRGGFGAMRWRR